MAFVWRSMGILHPRSCLEHGISRCASEVINSHIVLRLSPTSAVCLDPNLAHDGERQCKVNDWEMQGKAVVVWDVPARMRLVESS